MYKTDYNGQTVYTEILPSLTLKLGIVENCYTELIETIHIDGLYLL